jgi:hypothetical protein
MAEEPEGRAAFALGAPGHDGVADPPDAFGADERTAAGFEVVGDRLLRARLAVDSAELQGELRKFVPPRRGDYRGVFQSSSSLLTPFLQDSEESPLIYKDHG